MAVFLNNGVVLTVNAVDLSDHVTAVTINRSFDELEVTAMGDSGHKFVKGLEASSITIDFLNDTATSEVLQTLQGRWGQSTTITVKQTSDATSAANPLYTMSCLISSWTPVNGAIDSVASVSVSIPVTALTKSTSA